MSNVHTLPSVVHAVPFALKVSVGQAVLVPVQLSATSHSPATARHTVPAFPAGCVHVALVPLHTSVVHTLPSSVHVVPLALRTSGGQAVLVPSQISATSHSPAAARQTEPAVLMASAGQVALDPVQFSAASHRSTAARQTVADDLTASVGQVALEPVQLSARSHSLSAARHTVAAVTNVHVAVQQEPDWPFWAPRSHCSPASTWPSPHAALKVAMEAAQGRDGLSVPP